MPNKVCYVEGVFDLFHIGHLRIIKRSSEIFGKVVVGVHSDETVLDYKDEPIIPYRHRAEIIESCKFVDKVIEAPLLGKYGVSSLKFLNENNLDFLVHGKTNCDFFYDQYFELIENNRIFLLDETPDYHTKDLRKKCQINIR